ncbi:alpha/beta hydrolase [Thiolapillus sp.]
MAGKVAALAVLKGKVMKSILPLLLGWILLNGFMYLQQPSMVFFPYTTLDQTPVQWGLEYEDVYLETRDGVRLHGWYIPYPGAKQTLLFFHGNAGNISHRGASVEVFHQLGLNVFIFDYRGYGRSQGRPDEQGLRQDAWAAWRYLIEERGLEPKDIILFGRSIGGVVAAGLAAQVQPGGLILESTFSSARDMAEVIFPLLSHVLFLRFDFDTLAYVGQVRSPVLVLHSPDDEMIPFRLGKKIFAAANEPRYFAEMRGSHNGGFLESLPEYEQALNAFVSSLSGVKLRQ